MNTALLVLLISVVALLFLSRALLFLVQVEGWSMSPAYLPGDRLLALRYFPHRSLRRGQIVVWKLPPDSRLTFMPMSIGEGLFIKRIIGLPGDEVNAPVVKLPEAGEAAEQMVEGQELRKWHIPAGHCFVKGDSPGFDSTVFGPLSLHAVRGVILLKLPRRMKTIEEPYFVDSISPPPQKNP